MYLDEKVQCFILHNNLIFKLKKHAALHMAGIRELIK